MTNDEITPEQKETLRKVAMINLKDKGIKALAVAGLVEYDAGEGEYNKIAIDQFKYLPAIKKPTGKVGELMSGILLGSRAGGKRYTGNLSEVALIQKASEIYNGSLGAITVDDLMTLAGSKKEVAEDLKGKYLSEIDNGSELASHYMNYFTGTQVAEARKAMANVSKKGLEEAVTNPSNNA